MEFHKEYDNGGFSAYFSAYFERLIQLNSMEWTCALTGKTGLTFEEALESEREAQVRFVYFFLKLLQEFIDTFPEYLEGPILFLIHQFSARSRIDDLVNDIYVAIRDRFFIGEELTYREKNSNSKKDARVLNVSYKHRSESPKKSQKASEVNGEEQKENEPKIDGKKK